MGSKKHHKKESKKKKHRSRSRSPIDGEERERKRHKKHKDRKKDRSPDVEEVPVDSHLAPGAPPAVAPAPAAAPAPEPGRSASHERERRMRDLHRHDKEKEERGAEPEAGAGAGGGAQESLSVEDTNRLRAKLGLKPLQVSHAPAEDGKLTDELGEFYHVPAANIAQQQKADKLRQKLLERKEKRNIEEKFKSKTLGSESDSEDAAAWVQRERARDSQRRDAARQAAALDELDAQFGVGALVEGAREEREEREERRRRAYCSTQLRGLRVRHDLDANPGKVVTPRLTQHYAEDIPDICLYEITTALKQLKNNKAPGEDGITTELLKAGGAPLDDDRETILTLADAAVLADDEDVLVNVNLLDEERYNQNKEERRKAAAGHRAYDEPAELQAEPGLRPRVLAKYDEAAPPRGFTLGDSAALAALAAASRDRMRAAGRGAGGAGRGAGGRRPESLQLPAPQPARDYLDHHEIQAIFKKPKKKGKMRRAAKREPIDVDEHEAAPILHTDDTEVDATGLVQDDEETEPDTELQAALARARKLRQLDAAEERKVVKVEEILAQVKEEGDDAAGGGMVLDATAEFCRTLGDIPTYGQAGNRDTHDEIMELETAEADMEAGGAEAAGGAWSRVEVAPGPAELPAAPAALGAEPRLGAGVAGALQLALSKGYLERCGAAPAPRSHHLHLLQARHYSIEDKTYAGEDEKHGRRERGGYAGPLVEFREKGGFRPNIKLEYVDDDGHALCPKEAFRYLSHKFHGKGPGKNKQEKRIKKQVQEGLMKKMSSTDTPLNTLQMLQDKQRETHSPYIVLSGAKRDSAN